MDIQLEKKKGIQKKHIPYIAGGAVVLFLLIWIIFGNHASTLRIDGDALNIADVTYGEFNDYIRLNGQVQPISIVQLSPEEGGIVQEKVVEEGAHVKKGDIILRLSNSNLDLQILNAESELAEKQNLLRNTQVTMQQDKLNNETEKVVEEGAHVKKGDIILRLSNSNLDLQILNAESELAEKQNLLRNTQVTMQQDKLNNETEKVQLDVDTRRKLRTFQQYERLYRERLISREEFLQAEEDYQVAQKQHALISERLIQDSIYRTIQMDQMEDNLHNMRQNVLLIRERKDKLEVRAPIDGELGLLDVELGQNITAGQMVGQINDLSDFKIEAMIDEHYIDRVTNGLPATFERQGATFRLKVRKVYPEVRAPIDGELGLLDVELGQNITAGQMVGQINDLSDFKIEAMIDEHYIDRVTNGLPATFERQGATFRLKVRKVYPEVREGRFRTDLVFEGTRPENIRSGQTYYIDLQLGEPTQSVLIPKGTFFQVTGGNWIFVLDKDGKKAYRRQIRIGRQNPQYYEVLEGLEKGERVIVSGYESYKDNEVLILK